ncbi:protein lap4 (protein scribble) (protein smell-impaired) [Streptomyces lincolnensis]|uniref:Protein lap4 (Protein scribble) (Protein smell-impaired) n=1 Tax=Streptomyces lincolnensis TaxID=1915 RepID=A0A1B1MET6_STRLN|nr:leucine-rich repeat domain-containing protein [Streptomyces lincolnensis]ANS67084.1 protein lap4 (protein scribble) (protein smell-impaired) [Streptomyces lincolnensis]AXG55956.1 protein lap4 (protein scribble) (protein smell-impaired) [Streptomyces lincolnensis]
MPTPPLILLLSGSLRAGSTNEAVLRTVQALAPAARVRAVRYDGLAGLPHFNPDEDADPLPRPVAELREAIDRADGILICSPEYAGTLPGSFKNLLDWTVGGTEIVGKPVAWTNAAAPGRGQGAEATLRTVLGYTGAALVEPACVRIPVDRGTLDAEGLLTDPEARRQLVRVLGLLAGREDTPPPEDRAAAPHELNLWRRQLGKVPAPVWRRTELQILILADNGLTDLPPDIGRLHRLTTLDLGHNHLTAVPDELGALTGLTGFLYLHDNRLTELPASLGRLTLLRYLNVGENALTALPDSLGRMTSLRELRAQHNRLSALPDTLGHLRDLRELWLRGNALESLPASTADLHELRHLDLRENALAELPPPLARLPRLRHLDVRGNRLTRLPEWLLDLPALEKLDLRWNPCARATPLLTELERRGCVVLL